MSGSAIIHTGICIEVTDIAKVTVIKINMSS